MEEMKIYTTPWETDGTVRIIRIEGFLDTTTSQSLARRLEELLEQEVYRIIIDLEAVDYISSPGWGILVGDIRRIRENGGDLKLARMKPEVYEIYTLLGLDSFIESYDSVKEACERFAELPLVIEQPIETEVPESEVEEPRPTPEHKELVKTPEFRRAPDTEAQRIEEAPIPEAGEAETPPVKRKLSLSDMIREIVEEYPTYNTWQVKRELDTERYDFTRASWFKIYRELRRLRSRHLLAEERKLTMERRRMEEMRKDFQVERRLWEAERRLKLQKDELADERRELERLKEEMEAERRKFREETRRTEAELKDLIRHERALQAKLMNEILRIVREHPEYGPGRISEALRTSHLILRSPSTVYAKLRKADLNTKEKRLRFAEGELKDAEIQP
jgi:anti-sigma B factor antagonist